MALIRGTGGRTNGTSSADEIYGSTFKDLIYAGGGDDIIDAGWGNDTINGGAGGDTINGGFGNDTVTYSDAPADYSSVGVTVDLFNGRGHGSHAEGDTYISIENATGSNYGDFIIGNDGSNILNGLGGNDIISGGAGGDTMDGGDGVDTLWYAYSGGANPSGGVTVNLLTNTASGGDAEGDVIRNFENVVGTDFSDTLTGSHDDNAIHGAGGNDTIDGGDGNDTLFGDDGNDSLNGGTGDDTMIGGRGDDTYFVDSSSDVVRESSRSGNDSNDRVFSTAYSYTLGADVESLSLDTGAGAVYGTGNAQDNSIFGNSGSNTLNGGGGVDQINGLGGDDTFVFNAGQANGDTLHDFEGNGLGAGDVIYFVGYGTVAQGATFQQLDATHWEINSADGTIHDVIQLSNGAAIDGSDFSFY